jgi:Na+-driven multidrug efflux pump
MIEHFQRGDLHYTTGNIKRQILVAIASAGASLFAVFLVDIVSLVYIGFLRDERAMAAYGVAKLFTFLISTLLAAFTVACGALLSRLIEHESRYAADGFIQCLLTVAMTSIGVVVAIELAAFSIIARWLKLDGEIGPIVHEYIFIVAPAMIVMAAAHLSFQVLRTYGKVKSAMWISLASTGFFAAVAPVFMFSLDLGLRGTALAYAVTAVVSVAGCWIISRAQGGVMLTAPRLSSIRAYAPMLLRLTLPAWLGNLATFVGLSYLIASLVPYGASALAAMTVLDRLIQTLYCFFFAIPIALAPILGQNIVANNIGRVRDAINFTRTLILGYGALVWIISLGVGTTLASLAGLSTEGSSMLISVLIFSGPLWILIGRELLAVAMFVSFRSAWYVPAFAWLRATVGTIPFVWIGASLYGSSGAFIAMMIGNAGVAVIASIISQQINLKWQAQTLNAVR